MNNTFLNDLVNNLHNKYKKDIGNVTVVFPNHYSTNAFRECFARCIPGPIWLPEAFSINAFLQQMSPLVNVKRLTLINTLYKTCIEYNVTEESFDKFYDTASILLRDFDLLDKYLVHLDEFLPKLKSNTRQSLLRLYQPFKIKLQYLGIGYQGLCQRAAYELVSDENYEPIHKNVIFAGFCAFTPVVEAIASLYHNIANVEFYWDIDGYYVNNKYQISGEYLRRYKSSNHSFTSSFRYQIPEEIAEAKKEIEIIDVPSEAGQVHVIANKIKQIVDNSNSECINERILIALPNNRLALSLLYSLPIDPAKIYWGIGCNLKDTNAYCLLDKLLILSMEVLAKNIPNGYANTSTIISVLKNQLVSNCNLNLAKSLIQKLNRVNNKFVSISYLSESHFLFKTLFADFNEYQSHVITHLVTVFETVQKMNTNNNDDPPVFPMERLAITKIIDLLIDIRNLNIMPKDIERYASMIRNILVSKEIRMDSDYRQNIWVLKIADSINLDFDHVFILGMNEGDIPKQSSKQSLIPSNLEIEYSIEHRQISSCNYEYVFYRLLQRSKSVCITYNSNSASNSKGEVSRYVWQLRHNLKDKIKEYTIKNSVNINTSTPIIVHKKGSTIDSLNNFTVRKDSAIRVLTPSAINTYIDCKLKFYFKYILGVNEISTIKEKIDQALFGNIFHAIMETLYRPFLYNKIGRKISKDEVGLLQDDVNTTVDDFFSKTFNDSKDSLLPLDGQNIIAKEVMKKYVKEVLKADFNYAPYDVLIIEGTNKCCDFFDYKAIDGNTVRFGGIADRVDRKDEVVRVLDYKTVYNTNSVKSISSLFDETFNKRNRAALQVMFYSWVFYNKNNNANERITPCIVNVSKFSDNKISINIQLKEKNSNKYNPILGIAEHIVELEKNLNNIISEMLDYSIPFVQTQNEETCTRCPYVHICQRHL